MALEMNVTQDFRTRSDRILTTPSLEGSLARAILLIELGS